MMFKLETERLVLRPVTIHDLDDVYEYSSTPNVGPNAGWKPHESKEETLKIMEAIFIYKETIWGIVLKNINKLIGTIGYMDDPKREYNSAKMLGYAIGEAYWGNGYMTEAAKEVIRHGFCKLKLNIISAYSYPSNIRSKHVLEKCGFTYEGCLRKAEKLYNGEILDDECYSLTKDEYRKIVSV